MHNRQKGAGSSYNIGQDGFVLLRLAPPGRCVVGLGYLPSLRAMCADLDQGSCGCDAGSTGEHYRLR